MAATVHQSDPVASGTSTECSPTSSSSSIGIGFIHLVLSKAHPALPPELIEAIYRHAYPDAFATLLAFRRQRNADMQIDRPHSAEKPPSNGRCCFLEIPTELRMMIFEEWIPKKEIIIKPTCQVDTAKAKSTSTLGENTPPDTKTLATRSKKVVDIMCLNKIIKDEIATRLYEECLFEIHVHEGLSTGGVEFLDAGRQPLHYKLDCSDQRFDRFRDGKEFDFGNVKKIKVVVCPDRSEGRKHVPTFDYFMILSLVRLLQPRGGWENRLTYLAIEFADPTKKSPDSTGRRELMMADNPWWDPAQESPTASSLQFVPDFEFVLHPLLNLRAHRVDIKLPKKVCKHDASILFVENLKQTMVGQDPCDFGVSWNLERHLESIRAKAENMIYEAKYVKPGNKPFDAGLLNEGDFFEDDSKETGKGLAQRQKMSDYETEDSIPDALDEASDGDGLDDLERLLDTTTSSGAAARDHEATSESGACDGELEAAPTQFWQSIAHTYPEAMDMEDLAAQRVEAMDVDSVDDFSSEESDD